MDAFELLEAFEELPAELRPPLMKIVKVLQDTVKREDFLSLRETVSTLAEAQKKTEENLSLLTQRVDQLAQRMDELTQRVDQLAQRVDELTQRVDQLAQRMDELTQRVDQLAEAQRRTEEEIKKLASGLQRVRKEVGGLSRSVAYALENEAFRHLPRFLGERFGYKVLDRIVRAEIAGEEINFFAKVEKDGEEAFLVGESVLRLDDMGKLRQLWRKVEVVKEEKRAQVVPLIVTHFATQKLLDKAREAGVIVIQTFEF